MITLNQIRAHDRTLINLAKGFSRGLTPYFNQLFDELTARGTGISRTEVLSLFLPIRNYIEQTYSNLDRLVQANLKLTAGEIPDTTPSTQLEQLRVEGLAATLNQLEKEQQTIINSLVIGGIAGIAITPIVIQLRSTLGKIRARLTVAYETSTRNIDGALTLIRSRNAGIEKYRYVGGVIPTTRDFCSRHNGKEYTLAEINTIWRTQNWSGKAPGNPFIVRGGYNCRHMFVPIKDSANASS